MCKKIKYAVPSSASQMSFADYGLILDEGSPELKAAMMELVQKPFKVFQDRLSKVKLSDGSTPKSLICYAPTEDYTGKKYDLYGDFWREMSAKYHLTYLDLEDAFHALEISYYPTSQAGNHRHYTAYGNDLTAELLRYYLIEQKWVPFEPPAKSQ
jgi:hypothetical protein